MAEIALTFITPLIKSAISKAVSFAGEQLSLAWGLERNLADLARSLALIQQVLEDAERKQEINRSVRIWLEGLRDVAYEAADVLDEYGYELLRHKVKSQRCKQVHTFSCLSKPTSFSLNIATNIIKINESLNKIKSDGLLVQLVRSSSNQVGMQHPKTNSIFDCSKFVGRNSDVSAMVELLANMGSSSQHPPLSGISIVGFGGIGKTTLAKSICERVKSQSSYDLVAWVCVSEDFDAEKILKELLEYFGVAANSMANFDAIFQRLQAELEKKKILLVLDDVWDESLEKWNYLSSLLSKALKTSGNSIVVTTRLDKVACMAMERFPMHKHDVSKLSDEDCWLIIEDMVVRSSTEASVPSELEAIGRDIARRCGGLPLVASVIGGTLSREMTSENWRKIRDDEAWVLKDENKKIISILKLSFDRLPSPLKRCFSYCAIFPKDYVIEKDDLIHLWMAQEYLHPSKESSISMEDVGDMYFNDLLSNSLFQDTLMDAFGNLKSCKMHDLVHDLALFVSKGEILIWDGCSNIAESLNVRHLRVKFDGKSTPTIPRDIAQKLHTLFFEGEYVFCSRGSNLKSLRSLKLIRYRGKKLPLGKLKHLRYLDVSKTSLRSLSRFISKLYNLQTLNLLRCWQIQNLSNGTINLINLRHICFTYERHMPRIISYLQLTSLQSLSMFVVDQRKGRRLEELVGLSQIGGNLEIQRLELAKPTSTTLEDRKKLYSLTYQWSDEGGNIKNDEKVFESLRPHPDLKRLSVQNYKGNNWTSWMLGSGVNGSVSLFALQNMVELELSWCKCIHIPNLGLLSNLKELTIEGMSEVKSIGHKLNTQKSNSKGGGVQDATTVLYPALRRFRIDYMDRLEEWVDVLENAAAGIESDEDAPAERNCVIAFPCLEELRIRYCPKLKTWSMGGFCSDHKLASLEIGDCSSLVDMPRINRLSTLKTLEVHSCGQLRSLPIDLESCISLQKVMILRCKNLKSIGEHFGETSSGVSFPNLKDYTTGGFSPDLEEFPFPFAGLVFIHDLSLTLQSLTLNGWERVKSLPHQLQHLTALKRLEICNFIGIEDLPEWLRNLSSLQTLLINRCIKLKHLPSIEAMRCLSNLNFIRILECSELIKRCKKGGPEWPKISHISIRYI